MSSKTADEICKEAEALTNWFNNLSKDTSLTGYEILHLSNAMESFIYEMNLVKNSYEKRMKEEAVKKKDEAEVKRTLALLDKLAEIINELEKEEL